MKYFLFSILLLGCKPQPKRVQEAYENNTLERDIDLEILPYVERFEEYYKLRVINIPINLEETPIDKWGFCYSFKIHGKLVSKRIGITDKFDRLSDLQREELVFHELGHCFLDRDHDDSLIYHYKFGFIPNSIMYFKNIGGHIFYKELREYYLQELISNSYKYNYKVFP